MKIAIALVVFFFAGSAFAVDLVCTVPTAAVPRAVELCEELRLQLNLRTADWSNDIFASEFLRIGLRTGERQSTTRAVRSTVNTTINAAVSTFDSNFPVSVAAAECGDGTLDAEFGETCDDGNLVDGDGCDASCQTE